MKIFAGAGYWTRICGVSSRSPKPGYRTRVVLGFRVHSLIGVAGSLGSGACRGHLVALHFSKLCSWIVDVAGARTSDGG